MDSEPNNVYEDEQGKAEIYQNNSGQNEIINNTNENLNNTSEKARKRHRNKSDVEGRVYICPDCNKSYLSGPALTTHRKLKHQYVCPNSRVKGKGQENNKSNQQEKILGEEEFNKFFNTDLRRPPSMDQYINDNTITLEILKTIINDLYLQNKEALFKEIEDMNEHKLTKKLVTYWTEENNLTASGNDSEIEKLDVILFKYLREFSKKTNINYFGFIVKFAFVLRECFIKQSTINSQLSIKELPNYFNNFYFDYLDPNNFYGQETNEVCQLILHFGHWLYMNKYTDLHLGMYI